MIHVRNTAKELDKFLRRKEFNGVKVAAELQGSDEPEEDEQTVEEKALHDQNYACMTVEPLFDYDFGDDMPPYVTVEFNESAFWDDFKKHCQEKFGPDVVITVREQCNEVEFMRPSQLA